MIQGEMIGKTLSHYKITEKIGEGGMGIVYKADDTKLQRTVALKFLPLRDIGDGERKTRFIHEAQAAAALDHPNICSVYEIDEVGDDLFMVMPFIEGQSLEKKVESGPLVLKDVLDLAIQLADALQEAHRKGLWANMGPIRGGKRGMAD